MKANHSGRQLLRFALAGAALIALGSCATEKPLPPTPVPSPRPSPVVVVPPPAPRTHADWRDAPATPGNWTYTHAQESITHSPSPAPVFVAAYGTDRRSESLIALTCGQASSKIIVSVAGGGTAPLAATITTTSLSRQFIATRNQATGWWEIALTTRDPILDAMAFSRGRFMVEVEGQTPLYLPSWPEISRVIEDCR